MQVLVRSCHSDAVNCAAPWDASRAVPVQNPALAPAATGPTVAPMPTTQGPTVAPKELRLLPGIQVPVKSCYVSLFLSLDQASAVTSLCRKRVD